ncbi:Hsp20/alpha crystallin family protein [Altererythrobacter sp. ZODW24]|uniref:Hsp20/alpha crystallin family protein n=1 Tax=Altererythrobacter sp. ZODW24 TaxID=2185142 RepID=UPI000DF7DD8E|nr:Hsp20/alpha crystallin family protein [Altererythrobacter sp. ZODW24]
MNEQSLARQKTESAKQYLTDHLVEPFSKLRGEVEHMFDEFPSRWPALQSASRLTTSLPVPAVEMIETDDSYKVSVEVPGIDPKDVDLAVQQDMLIIKGEKREEFSESDRNHARSERSYGCFERHITMPVDANLEAVEASSKNGVITIEIPRDSESKAAVRNIPISAS